MHGCIPVYFTPKILTKPPARIFAAYRFLFMICHVLGTPLDQQETSNNYQSTNYIDFSIMPIDKIEHSKSYQHLQISRSPSHPANQQINQISKSAIKAIPQIHQISNSPFYQAAVVNPPAFFLPHKTDTKLATRNETCMVHYVLHHTLIHSLTLSGIR